MEKNTMASQQGRTNRWWLVPTLGAMVVLLIAVMAAMQPNQPIARAHQAPIATATRGTVLVTDPTSVRVVAGPYLCPGNVDLAVAAADPSASGCAFLSGVDYYFEYRVMSSPAIDSPHWRIVPAQGGDYANVGDGYLIAHERDQDALGPPRVFCSKYDENDVLHYANVEYDVEPGELRYRDTDVITTNNAYGYRFECLWMHASSHPPVEPTATIPQISVDPDDLIGNPMLPVTPVITIPTPTPAMPEVTVTLVPMYPIPVVTPVIIEPLFPQLPPFGG